MNIVVNTLFQCSVLFLILPNYLLPKTLKEGAGVGVDEGFGFYCIDTMNATINLFVHFTLADAACSSLVHTIKLLLHLLSDLLCGFHIYE